MALDIDLDFTLNSQNDLGLVSGKDLVIQRLTKRLLTRQGEFFADTSLGFNRKEALSIDEKKVSIERTELEFYRVVGEEPGISRVVSLSITDSNQTRQRTIKTTLEFDTEEIDTIEVVL